MSQALFRETLPVVILEAGTGRTIAALQSTHPTALTVSLTQPAAGGALTFTLSELSSRLLLLQQTITADSYAALRDSQALRVDFSDFPRELSTLLRQPEEDRSFLAVLSLAAPPAHAHTFEIVQLSDFRLLAHVELKPAPAPPDAVLASLAERARDAEAAASSAETARIAARAELDALTAALADARAEIAALSDELPPLRAAAAEADTSKAELTAATTDIASLRRELSTAHREREAGEEARRHAETALQTALAEADTLRARADALPAAVAARDREAARVAAMSDEVRKSNTTLERLRTEVRTGRERARVRNALIERQEEAGAALQKRVAEGERERRRLEDLAKLREVERDGLARKVEVLRAKAEETAVVLASDRECIAFLNRELNHRDILLAERNQERGRGGSRTNSEASEEGGRARLQSKGTGDAGTGSWTAATARAAPAAASE